MAPSGCQSVDGRHLRDCVSAGAPRAKTDTSKSIGRGVDNAHFVKKLVKKGVRHAVYYTLVA